MREPDCDEFLARVFALFDAELDASESEVLRAHVSHCPDCTRTVEAEQHVREVLRRSCREHAPDSLRMRVHAQLTLLRLRTEPGAVQ